MTQKEGKSRPEDFRDRLFTSAAGFYLHDESECFSQEQFVFVQNFNSVFEMNLQ